MRKKECIVHIGMHKTGSTSIQASLHKRLESKTFCYFDLGSANHSLRIFSLFSKEQRHTIHKKRNFTKKDIDDFNLDTMNFLIKNIDSCDKPVMIISGETTYRLLKNELEEFRDFLYQYFEKITIVAYVRTPKSFIESSFQQGIKGGVDKFNVERSYPGYRNRFEKFDLVFGRENVKFWKFNPKRFPDGSVVMDFCNRLGIEMQTEYTIRINDSLSKEALSLLYIYRKYGPGFGVGSNVISQNHKIIDALSNIGKRKIKFSPTLIKHILEQNREDLLWMEKRLGEDLNESMDAGIDDIENEEDLLTFNEETVQDLRDIIGSDYFPKEKKSNRFEEIAGLVHTLRMKMAKSINSNMQGDDEMKLIELAQKVQENNTGKLGKMNETKIALIIREAFTQVKNEIENTENDMVQIPGFGKFKIRMIEQEKEGQKVVVRRTIFKAAKEKEVV